ncbi:MAG: hypothetical protein E6G56_01890 [Actinobacteria bacterium]|nr:MAG: hypothetical protein E6G56_01890 [Actinomycetota bacterium]
MGLFGGRKRKQRLQEAGVNAPAEIISLRDTGVTVNNNPRVVLTLRVNPADGSSPFEVSKKQLISRVSLPRVGDPVTVRYDPEDHDNFEIGAASAGAANGAGAADLDAADAGEIASAVRADDSGVQQGSAAELLAKGQRMTAVMREFSPTGKTVGETTPGRPDPDDPVYVFKFEMPIEGGSPIEAICMNRVPMAKVDQLRIGERLNVAVNPANPTREVAIDWESSPLPA